MKPIAKMQEQPNFGESIGCWDGNVLFPSPLQRVQPLSKKTSPTPTNDYAVALSHNLCDQRNHTQSSIEQYNIKPPTLFEGLEDDPSQIGFGCQFQENYFDEFSCFENPDSSQTPRESFIQSMTSDLGGEQFLSGDFQFHNGLPFTNQVSSRESRVDVGYQDVQNEKMIPPDNFSVNHTSLKKQSQSTMMSPGVSAMQENTPLFIDAAGYSHSGPDLASGQFHFKLELVDGPPYGTCIYKQLISPYYRVKVVLMSPGIMERKDWEEIDIRAELHQAQQPSPVYFSPMSSTSLSDSKKKCLPALRNPESSPITKPYGVLETCDGKSAVFEFRKMIFNHTTGGKQSNLRFNALRKTNSHAEEESAPKKWRVSPPMEWDSIEPMSCNSSPELWNTFPLQIANVDALDVSVTISSQAYHMRDQLCKLIWDSISTPHSSPMLHTLDNLYEKLSEWWVQSLPDLPAFERKSFDVLFDFAMSMNMEEKSSKVQGKTKRIAKNRQKSSTTNGSYDTCRAFDDTLYPEDKKSTTFDIFKDRVWCIIHESEKILKSDPTLADLWKNGWLHAWTAPEMANEILKDGHQNSFMICFSHKDPGFILLYSQCMGEMRKFKIPRDQVTKRNVVQILEKNHHFQNIIRNNGDVLDKRIAIGAHFIPTSDSSRDHDDDGYETLVL
eukprot:TRINITY_DN17663_c0_g1_i1.p1 TRINITY_DN17663_c0_g1~~TRINITY_DN17663_c0_g1_i1.p1  ORF type:complete len:668 (+),score=110.42 TRINITY_DN17663_c0_g1_i1:44-2047(+)